MSIQNSLYKTLFPLALSDGFEVGIQVSIEIFCCTCLTLELLYICTEKVTSLSFGTICHNVGCILVGVIIPQDLTLEQMYGGSFTIGETINNLLCSSESVMAFSI